MSSGQAERAIRAHLREGQELRTLARGAPFLLSKIDEVGVTMLFGAQRTPTRLRWRVWEGAIEFLSHRDWLEIGTTFTVSATPSTLDGFLKGHMKRATAGWVAAVLDAAGLVEVAIGPPARIRSRRPE